MKECGYRIATYQGKLSLVDMLSDSVSSGEINCATRRDG